MASKPPNPRAMQATNPVEQGASDARVLLLLREGGNRRVLVEWFGKHYDIVAAHGASEARDGQDLDLCIMDPANFEVHREELIELKEARESCILPYLLILPGRPWLQCFTNSSRKLSNLRVD